MARDENKAPAEADALKWAVTKACPLRHEGGNRFYTLQWERRHSKGLQRDGHKLHRVVVRC